MLFRRGTAILLISATIQRHQNRQHPPTLVRTPLNAPDILPVATDAQNDSAWHCAIYIPLLLPDKFRKQLTASDYDLCTCLSN